MGRVDEIVTRSWHGSPMRRRAGVAPDENGLGMGRFAEAVKRDGDKS